MTYAEQLKLMCHKFFVSGPRLNCIPVLGSRHCAGIGLQQICWLLYGILTAPPSRSHSDVSAIELHCFLGGTWVRDLLEQCWTDNKLWCFANYCKMQNFPMTSGRIRNWRSSLLRRTFILYPK